MIKNNESKVLITNRNIKYYKDKGYQCNIDDIISIDINTIPLMSHNKVIAICELCKEELEIIFSKYNLNKSRQGFYSCKKCSDNKRKITNFEKYGVENSFKREDVKIKNKIWMSSNEFKQKSTQKILELYGVDHFSKTDEYKKNSSKMNKERIKELKEKNEYDCPFLWTDNKEKREKAMFEKYGSTYSFSIPIIKQKIQNINLEKFGHVSPFGNKNIQKSIKEKIIYQNLEKDSYFNGDLYKINKFKIYRRKIRYLTDVIRKKLFESWDGYDYYDGEYIKCHINLDKNNILRPTIDHKKSCFYGYINNIPEESIASMENLCITKRKLNVMKRHLTEVEFIKILNQ
jgi:hypothetical protein